MSWARWSHYNLDSTVCSLQYLHSNISSQIISANGTNMDSVVCIRCQASNFIVSSIHDHHFCVAGITHDVGRLLWGI